MHRARTDKIKRQREFTIIGGEFNTLYSGINRQSRQKYPVGIQKIGMRPPMNLTELILIEYCTPEVQNTHSFQVSVKYSPR